MIKFQDMIAALFPAGSPKMPTAEQLDILQHVGGPAWVLAGPGSGKTEVLALFALRLMYVSGETFQQECVPPHAILLTTFTEKAAKNLEDRVSRYRAKLIEAYPQLGALDTSELRIGTLHGLCNDLLQEYRAPTYQNVRLMDEFEQAMFVYEHVSAVKQNPQADLALWSAFSYLFHPHEWQGTYTNLPNKWLRTSALVKLFNRIAEDRVSVSAMRAHGGHWARVADLHDEYVKHLADNHRCDFSRLQTLFLEFLGTRVGKAFLTGAPGGRDGIKWILVDEYQDTNLMQEAIYLHIAAASNRNLVVVGDDDQAMYRFRGGSVECMVTFDEACKVYLNVPSSSVARYPLAGNFRSHPEIVKFFNDYISAFPSMTAPGSRVPGKKGMAAKSKINGTYPAVGILEGKSLGDVATRFAKAVSGLISNNIVHDPSQCCLLLTSTKETPHNAQKYVEALRNEGLRPYNPRNKAFLEQEEVQALLGALQALVDPTSAHLPNAGSGSMAELNGFIAGCRATYEELARQHAELRTYVDSCVQDIAKHPGEFVNAELQEIAYLILSCEPFSTWHSDPVRRVRLARLTALLESFASMPVLQSARRRGSMWVEKDAPYAIAGGWVWGFYHLFFGYLARAGMDEVGDDEVICPPGYIPIMTIHQAKGLEFPITFVGHLSEKPRVNEAHRLEDEFSAFPTNPQRVFKRASGTVRAELDRIRQFYVAFSRAEYALVLVGTKSQVVNSGGDATACGPTAKWLTQRLINL